MNAAAINTPGGVNEATGKGLQKGRNKGTENAVPFQDLLTSGLNQPPAQSTAQPPARNPGVADKKPADPVKQPPTSRPAEDSKESSTKPAEKVEGKEETSKDVSADTATVDENAAALATNPALLAQLLALNGQAASSTQAGMKLENEAETQTETEVLDVDVLSVAADATEAGDAAQLHKSRLADMREQGAAIQTPATASENKGTVEQKTLPGQNTAGTDTPPAAKPDASFQSAIQKAADKLVPQQNTQEIAQPVQQPAAPQQVQAAVNVQAAQAPQFDPASNKIMQQVGAAGWDQAIGQKMIWMAGKDQQQATLSLNPPELGPLQVVIKVSNNQASAHFSSAYPEVRHALENSLPRLREMFDMAGIQLGQAQVGAENSGQSAAMQSGQSSGGRGGSHQAGTIETGMENSTARTATIPVRQGLVDTFA